MGLLYPAHTHIYINIYGASEGLIILFAEEKRKSNQPVQQYLVQNHEWVQIDQAPASKVYIAQMKRKIIVRICYNFLLEQQIQTFQKKTYTRNAKNFKAHLVQGEIISDGGEVK